MMQFTRPLVAAAILISAFAASPASAADAVYVMRHLQKGEGSDPSLSGEGAAGAQAVAQLLAGKAIAALYATRTRRAEETAAPLAARLGLSVTPYDPRDPGALVKAVAAVKGAVLVVGHSNTVPDLVAGFGGSRPADLSESDYETVFLVRPGSAAVERIELKTAR